MYVCLCTCECMRARPWKREGLANAKAYSISELSSQPKSNKHTQKSDKEKQGIATASYNP